MTDYQDYFLHLLACFLNGEPPQRADANMDWTQLFKLADLHELGGIIGFVVQQLPDDALPPGALLSALRQRLGYAVQHAAEKEKVSEALTALLTANGIDHLFVKWTYVRQFYAVPELRTSGDIDVIVRSEMFDKVKALLKREAMSVAEADAHTLKLILEDVEVEIHRTADVKNNYFNDIFSLCTAQGCTYELPHEEHLFYVFCHLAKHLAYRGAGVRMLMDMDVLIRAQNDFSAPVFLEKCRTVGLEKTAMAMFTLLHIWFHTPLPVYCQDEAFDAVYSRLKTVFIEGGAFGYAINAVPMKYVAQGNRFHALLKMAFPGKNYLQLAYPYCQHKPVLLPFACMHRLFDGVFKKRHRAQAAVSQLAKADSHETAHLALLKELQIMDIATGEHDKHG